MDGHALTFHETNTARTVALCGCGWVGPLRWTQPMARDDHSDHVASVRREQAIAIPGRAEYVQAVTKIVRRTGRYSTS